MNILIINQYAGSKKHGMVYRPYYLAHEWMKLGHNVGIVAGSFSHARNIQPDKPTEMIDGIKYFWLKNSKYDKNNIYRFRNILAFINQLKHKLDKICQGFKPDIIISSSTHNLDIYTANKCAKKYNSKLVYEVRNLWPLSPIQVGGMSKNNVFIRLVQKAEDFAYRNADTVVSLIPKAFDYMHKHGLDKKRFNYIPSGIDIADWDNTQPLAKVVKNTILSYKSKSKIIIGYTGAHGKANALSSLIEAAIEFNIHDISLVLVGDGLEKDKLVNRYAKYENIHFIDSVPKEQIPSLIELFDICYIGLINQPLFKYGISPNKVLDYMMAGKPVIHAINSSNDIVAESHSGFSVKAENVDDLIKTFAIILKTPKYTLNKMGQNGKKYVLKHHNYKVLAKKYLDAIGG